MKIMMIILAVILAAAGVAGMAKAIGALRQNGAATRGMILRRYAFLAVCTICLVGGIVLAKNNFSGLFNNDEQTSPDAVEAGQTEEATSEDAVDTETETLPEGAFFASLSEKDLLTWCQNKFGEKFSFEEACKDASEDCYPTKHDERVKEATKAETLWNQRFHNGAAVQPFSDPVWYPLWDIVENWEIEKWQGMTAEQRLEWFSNRKLVIFEEIIRNPIYGDAWRQFIYEYVEKYPEILERNNSWLPDYTDACARAWEGDNPAGLAEVFFEKNDEGLYTGALTEDYVKWAARLCILLDEFTYVETNPVQELEAKVNWHLAFCADADFSRTTKSDPEDKASLLLAYQFKGKLAMLGGANLFDGRPEIFVEDLPLPDPDPDPIPIPDPKKANLIIEHKDINNPDGPSLRDDFTAVYPIGYQYTYNTPAISGWTIVTKKATGTIKEGTNRDVVYYHKKGDDPFYYHLTIYYKSTVTKQEIAPKHGPEKLEDGSSYSVKSPIIAGYGAPDKPVVSGTIKGKDVEVTVWYTPQEDEPNDYTLTIYYVNRATGAQVAKTYGPETLKDGSSYSVTSPTVSGFQAPDKPVVSGTIKGKDVVVTVYYDKIKNPDDRPTGGDVPDGKTDGGSGDEQPNKPDQEDYVPPTKTQKPTTEEGQSEQKPAKPDKVVTDTTVTDTDGSTHNTKDDVTDGFFVPTD